MRIRNLVGAASHACAPALIGLAQTCANALYDLVSLTIGTEDDADASAAPVAVEPGTAEQSARAENHGTISVDGTDERALFDYYKADLAQMDSRFNRSLSAFAMAALQEDSHGESYRESGDWAHLTNDGEIRMNMGELLRRYGPEMTAPGDMEPLSSGKLGIRDGSDKKYLSLMLWGMLGGCHSTLVNNGRILTECDTDNPEGTENVFTHPMYVYHRSTMVNNGEVVVRGRGSRGINPRGLTSQKNDLTVVNNGSIVLDVESAYLSRALTVAGCGSTITNRGLVSVRSSGTVFGAGHTGSSTLLNKGRVEATTMGVLPKEKIGVLATFAARSGAYALSAVGPDYMMEQLHEKFGVQNWKGGGITNAGVVKAAVRDAGSADANSVAAGILLLDSHMPYNGWYTVRNTGVIRTASDLRPCEANGHRVNRAELVVNCVHMPEQTFPARVRIKEWATELRDFGACADLILARSDSEGSVELSFADAELILRPAEHYEAGTAYRVSAPTLAAPVDAPTLEEARVQVTGMEYLRFRTELPEFLQTSVEETAPGDYQVSLKLADNPQAQRRMLSVAALGPVDFLRQNLDELDRMLGEDETNWTGQAYQSHHSRVDGLTGQVQGIAGCKDVGFGPLLRFGIHGVEARERSHGGLYHAQSNMRADLEGGHLSLWGGALRAQFTRFHLKGRTDFALHTPTGICLEGRSDGNQNGGCACAHLRRQLRLGKNHKAYAEAGISCLRFHRGSCVDWSFKEEPLPGYRMETTPMSSLRGSVRLGWQSLFGGGRNGRVSLSLEGSGALFDSGSGLRMLNESLGERVREDPIQLSVSASLRRRIGGWMLNVNLQGGLGKNSRQNRFSFTLRPDTRS